MHPRRTRGSQSGQEKSRRDKSLQAQVEEPLGTNSHQTISNSLANASIWLGTKDSLYYLAQLANSISWVLFVCSYTTAIFSPYLSGLFIKIVCARETFYSPNRNEGTTNESEKRLGCYQQEHSSKICTKKIMFLTDHKVSKKQ